MSKCYKLVCHSGEVVGQHTKPQKWSAVEVKSPLKKGKKKD